MIQGVELKELKLLDDERGFLMEILRCDDRLFERFGQAYITACKSGVAKAWHYHKQQTDNFACLWGKSLVVLYDMREDSPTSGSVEEFILEAPPCEENRPLLLKIPPLVVHGFTSLGGEEARIINIPTMPYRYDDPDEHRLPWDSELVPFQWPPEVRTGG